MALRAIEAPLSSTYVKAMDAGKRVLDEMYHRRMINFFKNWNIMGGHGKVHFKAQLLQDSFERGF